MRLNFFLNMEHIYIEYFLYEKHIPQMYISHIIYFCPPLSLSLLAHVRKFFFYMHRLPNGACLTLYNDSDLSISHARLSFGMENTRGL